MGFELGTFRLLLQRLNPLGHSPQKTFLTNIKNISQVCDTPAKLIQETKALVPGFYYINFSKTIAISKQLSILKHAEIILFFKKNDKTEKCKNRLVRATVTLLTNL